MIRCAHCGGAHATPEEVRACSQAHPTEDGAPASPSPTPPPSWLVYADGASRGNPGAASYGALVIDPEGNLRHEASERIGVATNNVAEYRGLIAGLEAALALGARRVEVRLDSELLVRQAIGRYRVKNPGLIPLHNRVVGLRGRFDEVVFRHVPREQNKRADALANQALDRPA